MKTIFLLVGLVLAPTAVKADLLEGEDCLSSQTCRSWVLVSQICHTAKPQAHPKQVKFLESKTPTNIRLKSVAPDAATKSVYFPTCEGLEAYSISYEYKVQRLTRSNREQGIIYSLRALPGTLKQRRGSMEKCDPELLTQMDKDFMEGRTFDQVEKEMGRQYSYTIVDDILTMTFEDADACPRSATQTGQVISTFKLEGPASK